MSVVDFGPSNGESSKANGGGPGCQCVSCGNRPLKVSSWIVFPMFSLLFFHVYCILKSNDMFRCWPFISDAEQKLYIIISMNIYEC